MEFLAIVEVRFHFRCLLKKLHTALLVVENIDEILRIDSEHLWDLFSFSSADFLPHIIDEQFQGKQLGSDIVQFD